MFGSANVTDSEIKGERGLAPGDGRQQIAPIPPITTINLGTQLDLPVFRHHRISSPAPITALTGADMVPTALQDDIQPRRLFSAGSAGLGTGARPAFVGGCRGLLGFSEQRDALWAVVDIAHRA